MYQDKRLLIFFVNNALKQAGPWQNQNISVTSKWFIQELKTKIKYRLGECKKRCC